MKLPTKYQAARKALAAAVRVDEVKSIRNKAIAMQVYAIQAKDAELVAASAELRERATRRLGELMEEQRKAGKMAKAPAGPGRGKKGKKAGLSKNPTLTAQGVDKNLADRARKAAAVPKEQFEAHVAKTVKRAVAAVDGDKAAVREARQEAQHEKKTKRAAREKSLAAKQTALPTDVFGVIYADPPWRFAPYSEETGMDRAADNHYSTMTVDKIAAMKPPAADDCVLFLWATAPMLPQALEVMQDWGFIYKSHFVWFKDKIGTGYWSRNQHELLLVGTKGKIPAPAPGTQYPSVLQAPVGKHSAKPMAFREMIEDLFPTLPRIELFARETIDGWSAWGNEV